MWKATVVSAAVLLMLVACAGDQGSASQWTELRPMDVARSEHPAVILGEEIIVIGGLVESGLGGTAVTASVEAYDPDRGSWRSLPGLPAARHHLMAAVVGSRLFVIGGFSESGFDAVATVWELVDEGWNDRSNLPVPIGAGAAVVLDGLIYVVGGSPAGGLYRYHPDDNEWSELTPPRLNREHLAAVVAGHEIWAIGGRWQGDAFDSTEIYTTESDSWREGPSLVEARSGFGATVLGSFIVVAGGEVFDPTTALSSVEELGAEGEWTLIEPLPVGLHGNPLAGVGSTIYLPGGSSRAAGVSNSGEMLSLDLG